MTHDAETETPPARIERADNHFGACPLCGGSDQFLNIGRDHWMVCERHKVKWPIGSNLFGCWRSETEEDWKHNAEVLRAYAQVKPVYSNTEGLPPAVAVALNALLDHYWSDESNDFLSATEPGVRQSHIFNQLRTLDCWMKDSRCLPRHSHLWAVPLSRPAQTARAARKGGCLRAQPPRPETSSLRA